LANVLSRWRGNMATDIRTPYLYVFSMAYYTLTRILYFLNEVNIH